MHLSFKIPKIAYINLFYGTLAHSSLFICSLQDQYLMILP